ncbi:hypothetical protein PCL_08917 [Purpureocillium lilacinum]|uniref:Uncharacterized protein n=2 Tax=Purpureocillium lilacinum TaxID=33203 RepID=A0ACC4DUA3_PURLI|nr:hypothetical protein PCL_08917 [Purpureocillium lilacinum]
MDTAHFPSASTRYRVSRSRGKQPGESLYISKLRARRKDKGMARSSDESESDEELEQGWSHLKHVQAASFSTDRIGAIVLHQLFNRKVVLYPDNTVVKSGKRIAIGEADALKVAEAAGIPAPAVHDAHTDSDGVKHIRMSYIEGETLDKLWPDLPAEKKSGVARQLRVILEEMRSVTPPPNFVGACDGTQIRDTRLHFTYHAPFCTNEKSFNEYLLSSLYEQTPPVLREAFSRRLRTDHRIVLSHCDLTPRNILVHDGKVKGIIDWEDSGWYPAYWEFVKFFLRPAERGWKEYAEEIFPELYQDELVDLIAISKWQND